MAVLKTALVDALQTGGMAAEDRSAFSWTTRRPRIVAPSRGPTGIGSQSNWRYDRVSGGDGRDCFRTTSLARDAERLIGATSPALQHSHEVRGAVRQQCPDGGARHHVAQKMHPQQDPGSGDTDGAEQQPYP